MAHTRAPVTESTIKGTNVQDFLQGIKIVPCSTEYTVDDALCAYEAKRESLFTELRIRKVQDNIRNKIRGKKSNRIDLVFCRNMSSDLGSDMSCLLSKDGDSSVSQAYNMVLKECCASHSGSMYDSTSEDNEYAAMDEPTLFLSSVADIYNQDALERVEYADDVTETTVDGLPVFNAAQDLIRKKLEEKEECKKFGFEQLM
eukprot:jgi/Antlo1/2099/349